VNRRLVINEGRDAVVRAKPGRVEPGNKLTTLLVRVDASDAAEVDHDPINAVLPRSRNEFVDHAGREVHIHVAQRPEPQHLSTDPGKYDIGR